MPVSDFQSSEKLKEGTLKMDYLLRDVNNIPAFKHLNKPPEAQSRSKQPAYPVPQIVVNGSHRREDAPVAPEFSKHGNAEWLHGLFPVSNPDR